jgi:hypothetical protein
MKNRKMYAYSLVMVSVFFLGCATTSSHAPNNNHQHEIDVSLHPEDHIFTNVDIRHSNGEAVLYGSVKHNHRDQEVNAHVDVAVLDSSGNVHYKGSVSVGSSRVRGRYRLADFRLRFPDVLKTDTVVHVAYHSDRLKHNREHDCRDNQAVEMGVK